MFHHTGFNKLIFSHFAAFKRGFKFGVVFFSVVFRVHRCWISQCEDHGMNNFTAEWTKFAVPYTNGRPDSCHRYLFVGSTNDPTYSACSQMNFNQSHVIPCESFVIKHNEDRLLARVRLLDFHFQASNSPERYTESCKNASFIVRIHFTVGHAVHGSRG